MLDMDCKEFLGVMREASKRGYLRFKHKGAHYIAPIEEIWLGGSGKCVIVSPDVYVRKDVDEWGEMAENGPRHYAFDWIAATYYWLSERDATERRFCIETEDGPIYVIIPFEEAIAA